MKTKSANDMEAQMLRIIRGGGHFDRALDIYSRYLGNIALYLNNDRKMTTAQRSVQVPRDKYMCNS